jgi:hypothetical protein
MNIDNFDINNVSIDTSNDFWQIKYNKDNLNIFSNEEFIIENILDESEAYKFSINIANSKLYEILKQIYDKTIESFEENPNYNFINIKNNLKIKISDFNNIICHVAENNKTNYKSLNKSMLNASSSVKIGIKSIGPWFIKNEDTNIYLCGISWHLTHIKFTR